MKSNHTKNRRVVVIGAGPTGLSAAYYLVNGGGDAIVLEKQSAVGGMAKTIKYKDIKVDFGPHRFTPHTQQVKDLVFDLMGSSILIKPQVSKIYLWGNYLSYPLKMTSILRSVNPLILLKIGFSYLLKLVKSGLRGGAIRNYREYMEYNFGPYLAREVFCPIIEKTWKLDPSEISLDLAKQRVAMESLLKTFLNIILKRKPAVYATQLMPADHFYYPQGGFGTISEKLKEEILKQGGHLELKAELTGIICKKGKATAVTYKQEGLTKTVLCDSVIATCPLTEIVSKLSGCDIPAGIKQASEHLKFRHLRILFLVLNRNRLSEDISIFYPDLSLPFGRLFEQKNYDEHMVPEGKTVLGVELTCADEDYYWSVSDEGLGKEIINSLVKVGLITAEEVLDYFSQRNSFSYPVYDLEYKDNLEKLTLFTDQITNLIIVGRAASFLYNNTHHSLEMGYLAAKQVLSGDDTIKEWAKDRELFHSYTIVE